MEKLLYTTEEAKHLVSLSTTGLYKAIANGDLRSFKLGRKRLFHAQDLKDYVERVDLRSRGGAA